MSPRRSRARLWWGAGILMAVALGAGAIWLLWFSSVLAVREVRIEGVDPRATELVRSTAGVRLGEPMMRADTAAVASRVQGLEWVRTVEVGRSWPDAVSIAVTARQPVASLPEPGRAIDEQGVAFTPLDPPAPGLPRVEAQGEGLAEAASSIAGMPPELRARVVLVRATTRDDVTLELRSGATVRWGSAEEGPLKAQVLEQLLRRQARSYDVSVPEQPTTVGER